MEGKFSLWFVAALALAEGNVTLDKFTDEKVNDHRINQLMAKIDTELVRKLKLGANVVVKMKNGEEYKGIMKNPKGTPANPLRFDEIANKFRNTAKFGLVENDLDDIIEKIKNFEIVKDVKEIIGLAILH